MIRTQTKSWDVPYCRACLAHIRAADRLARFGWLVVHRPAVATVLTAVLAALMVLMLREMPWFFAVAFGAVWAAALGFGFRALLSWCECTHQEALRQREQSREALQDELDSCVCESCARVDTAAAEYGGWNGTVHTFFFANRDFAELFCQSNAGKILR